MTLNNLSAAKGDSKGEVNLQWDSVKNAVSYIIEIANPDHSKELKWKVLDITSDSRCTLRNLKSKKEYLFRVAPMSRDGQEKWSDEVRKKAP